MVRGVRLETNPSGSYYNASEGAFANVTVVPQPITVGINPQPGGFVLTWNSLPARPIGCLSIQTLLFQVGPTSAERFWPRILFQAGADRPAFQLPILLHDRQPLTFQGTGKAHRKPTLLAL